MKKLCQFTGLLLFFLGWVAVALAEEGDGYPVGPGLEVRLTADLAVGTKLGHYWNIPVAARTVPIHKDDGWLGTPGTPVVLADYTLEVFSPAYGLGVSAAGQYAFPNGVIFRAGVQTNAFSRSLKGPTKGSSDNTVASNQYGTGGRGEGMSLMYYALGAKFSRTFSPFGELQMPVGERSGIVFGFARRQRTVYVQSGYDRNDSLETYAVYDLDKKFYNLPYFGANIGLRHKMGFLFRIGYELQPKDKTIPNFLQDLVYKPRVWDLTFGTYYTLSKTRR